MFSKKRMSLPRQWQRPTHLGEIGFDVSRVRNPVTRSRGLVRGQFPSTKSKRMVAWESQLEERACYLFEFTRTVQSFREQPVTVEYIFEGKVRTYIPDFEVTCRNGLVCYIEIKPLQKLQSSEERYRFDCIAQTLNRDGCAWHALTETELPSPHSLHTLKLLRTYLRCLIPPTTIQKAQKWLSQTNAPTFAMFAIYLDSSSIALALIAQGFAFIDLNQLLLDSTLVTLIGGIQNETRLFTARSAPSFEQRELSYCADTGGRYRST